MIDENFNDDARVTAASAAAARAARVTADVTRVRNHLRSCARPVVRRQTPAEDENRIMESTSRMSHRHLTRIPIEVPELNVWNRMIVTSATAVVAASAKTDSTSTDA